MAKKNFIYAVSTGKRLFFLGFRRSGATEFARNQVQLSFVLPQSRLENGDVCLPLSRLLMAQNHLLYKRH